MKEIEVLVMIKSYDMETVLNKIQSMAKYISQQHVLDVYYYDPLRTNLQPDKNLAIYECFRLRQKEAKNYVTYKVDKFDSSGKWLYSDESETEVVSYDNMTKIIAALGLKKLVVVDMVKYYFETREYTIAFELVENLGAFLEVESKNTNIKDNEIEAERKKIQEFINSLGVETTPDLGIGKPELLLKKLGWNK